MKKRQMVGRIIIIMIVGVGMIIITPSTHAKTAITTVTKPSVIDKSKVTVEGIVQLVHKNKDRITLKDENGTTYEIFLGPIWTEKNVIKVGERIKVEGVEHKNGKITAWTITREDGNIVSLRSSSGKPEWIGKHTKGSKGYGSH